MPYPPLFATHCPVISLYTAHRAAEFFTLLNMNWLFLIRPLGDTDVLFMIL